MVNCGTTGLITAQDHCWCFWLFMVMILSNYGNILVIPRLINHELGSNIFRQWLTLVGGVWCTGCRCTVFDHSVPVFSVIKSKSPVDEIAKRWYVLSWRIYHYNLRSTMKPCNFIIRQTIRYQGWWTALLHGEWPCLVQKWVGNDWQWYGQQKSQHGDGMITIKRRSCWKASDWLIPYFYCLNRLMSCINSYLCLRS